PAEPAGSHRWFTPQEVFDAQADRDEAGSSAVASGGVGGVALLPRGDRFVHLADPPRRVGEALGVLGGEGGRIEGAELVVGLGPCGTGDGIASPVDVRDPLVHPAPFSTRTTRGSSLVGVVSLAPSRPSTPGARRAAGRASRPRISDQPTQAHCPGASLLSAASTIDRTLLFVALVRRGSRSS